MNIDELIHHLKDIRAVYGNLIVTHETDGDNSLLINTITIAEDKGKGTFVCLGYEK